MSIATPLGRLLCAAGLPLPAAPAYDALRVAAASWPAGGKRMLAAAAGGGSAAPAPPPHSSSSSGAPGAGMDDASSEEVERAASLPVEQLAKALLVGNMRAQLTTITAGEPGADESKVTSSVATYLSPRGEAPVVLLSREDAEHLKNLEESGKASLATGHISPPWFIRRLRATGWLPRRVAMLGTLELLPAPEVKWAVEQARKACAAAPALTTLLPGGPQLPSLLGFRLAAISQCVYVDAAGRQHGVAPADLDATYIDPLALSQHDMLAALNQDPAWQAQLRLFCAAYLGVHAGEVLLAEADRLGFTLLGSPPPPSGVEEQAAAAAGSHQAAAQQSGPQQAAAGPHHAAVQQQVAQQRWRQFRIGFNREVRSPAHFMELLEQMKGEVAAAAGAV